MPLWPRPHTVPRMMSILNSPYWTRVTGTQPTNPLASVAWPTAGLAVYSPITVSEYVPSADLIIGFDDTTNVDAWDVAIYSDVASMPGDRLCGSGPRVAVADINYFRPLTPPWVPLGPATYWIGVSCSGTTDKAYSIGALSVIHGPLGFFMELNAFPLPDIATPIPMNQAAFLPWAGLMCY